MIKRILKYFGYISKEEITFTHENLLNQIKDLEELVEDLNNQRMKLIGEALKRKKLTHKLEEHLKEKDNIIYNIKEESNKNNIKYLSELTLLKSKLESETDIVKELKLLNKELKRKNTRLLNKQKEFKEKIVLLESDNLRYKSESVFWKLYSQKAVDKLEYICFGSVLPQVVRSIDLSKYQTPSDKVQYEWYETKDGIGVRANEK